MTKVRSVGKYIFLIIASVISVFPLVWMAISATNTSVEVVAGKMTPGTYLVQNFKNLLGSARAALLPIPGVMVQCNEPPASCSKIEHPGLNVFEAQLKIVEQEMQANYKNALKGIAKKPRVLLFMRKEGSGAVKYMPRIAKKTKEASLALSGQISRSSFICR